MTVDPQRLRQMLQLSLIGILFIGCRGNVVADQKVWSDSMAAPSSIEFWAGSGKTMKLPVHKNEFIKLVSSLGGSLYTTGQGDARSLGAPPPSSNSPCKMTSRAIVVDFAPSRAGETPRFVAYIDSSDMIQCVDKQFSYSG
jgi:hypothetical protein